MYTYRGGMQMEVSVKDARSQLSELLDRVERGEEVIIRRRGKKVARLVSPETTHPLPSLRRFRASLKMNGKPMSEMVITARDQERY
jgi:prevent-host-death family protein